MCTRNRITWAALVLLAAGMLGLAAYAGEHDENGLSRWIEPGGPGYENNVVQQAQPYQVYMNPVVMAQPQPQAQPAANGPQNVDLFLIPCLINANRAEVALSNLAAQRGQSSEVKNFAQQAIKDYSAGEKEFQQLDNRFTAALRPQNPDNTPVAATLYRIREEINQNCLANAQRVLEQLSGADFDRCYISMEIGLHFELRSTLGAFKNYATSPELKKAIGDASQVAGRNLDEARKIAKELESRGNNNNSTAAANR